MLRIIADIGAINTYGMICELDRKNMTWKI